MSSIEKLWCVFNQSQSTVYIPSKPGYQPMDGYALYYLSRRFHADSKQRVVPVLGYLPTIDKNHLIIIGRLWVYQCKELIEKTIGDLIRNKSSYLFIDNLSMLSVSNSELLKRVENSSSKSDYGLVRMVKNNGRMIFHVAGLGSIGTMGAMQSITFPNDSIVEEMDQAIKSFLDKSVTFGEILIKSEWCPNDDIVVVRPEDVRVGHLRTVIKSEKLNWPQVQVDLINHELYVLDKSKRMCLTNNPNEFAILYSIAKNTKKYNYDIENVDGYITYAKIEMDDAVKSLNLSKGYIRVTLGRILERLSQPEWIRKFPNLILKSNVESKTKKVGYQFRTKNVSVYN